MLSHPASNRLGCGLGRRRHAAAAAGTLGQPSIIHLAFTNWHDISLPSFPAAGVGLDFNTELIEEISKVRGANYYSVHSPGGCWASKGVKDSGRSMDPAGRWRL